jgi:peptidoglycan hydrolase-like protein with peptidoglycan-binding domain
MLLKKGDNNESVKQLQVKLGLDPVGNFGPRTEEAIKAFLFDLSPAIALSKAPLAQAVASACLCAISCADNSIATPSTNLCSAILSL